MIAEGLNPADQLVIERGARTVLKLAHALVEEIDQILDAIGHRRIGGEAGIFRFALLGQQAIAAARAIAILQIGAFGERNDFRQDFDFFLDAGPAAEEGVDGLLEIEQPERQPQIARIEHIGLVAEATAIFVVRIDQKDAQVRTGIENLLQDDGDATRFADAGGAENGEVTADQIVDVDMNADILVLLQVTDMGVVGIGGAIDHAQFTLAEHGRAIADVGIFGDTALKARCATVAVEKFADQVEVRDLAERLAATGHLRRLLADIGDQTDDDRLGGGQAHEAADRRRLAVSGAPGQIDGRLRTVHRDDAADRLRNGSHGSVQHAQNPYVAAARLYRICRAPRSQITPGDCWIVNLEYIRHVAARHA